MAADLRASCLSTFLAIKECVFCEEEDQFLLDDSSDDILMYGCASVFCRRALSRIRSYFEVTVPMYEPDVFRSHFRLSRTTFELLCRIVVPSEHFPKGNPFGREVIEPSKQVAVGIWMLANQETHREISDRFDITLSSVSRCCHRFTRALTDILQEVVLWPSGRRAFEVTDGFEQCQGFPRVIGAVDGCHIRIRKPSHCPDAYQNRLKYHSIILQGVCDHEMLFTDIYVGWPGSVHDARVLRNSPLFTQHNNNGFQGDSHLLGDSAYPLNRWLLVPFKNNGHLTAAQIRYNTKHSGTRQVIERAFGLLKGRWRRLKALEMELVEEMSYVVTAACVLHNFCLLADIGDIEQFFDDDDDDDSNDDDDQNEIPRPQATAKRMLLVNYLNTL